MFSFMMQATMTALLAATFTIPMQRASHQTACRPVWSEAASPCYYQAATIGTTSFFDEDDLLPEDEPQRRNGEGKFDVIEIVVVSRDERSWLDCLY
jgi:hypothetical protein